MALRVVNTLIHAQGWGCSVPSTRLLLTPSTRAEAPVLLGIPLQFLLDCLLALCRLCRAYTISLHSCTLHPQDAGIQSYRYACMCVLVCTEYSCGLSSGFWQPVYAILRQLDVIPFHRTILARLDVHAFFLGDRDTCIWEQLGCKEALSPAYVRFSNTFSQTSSFSASLDGSFDTYTATNNGQVSNGNDLNPPMVLFSRSGLSSGWHTLSFKHAFSTQATGSFSVNSVNITAGDGNPGSLYPSARKIVC
jgi:hypothetical protein